MTGTYWRSRTDPKLIASVWKETADGIELLEMGGDDPQGALTYWHERPKQAPQTWRFKDETELREGWERVERGWIAVDEAVQDGTKRAYCPDCGAELTWPFGEEKPWPCGLCVDADFPPD